MTTFVGFAFADPMTSKNPNCLMKRQVITIDHLKEELGKSGVVNVCNPSHMATLKALQARHGLDLIQGLAEKAPLIDLLVGDKVLVISVRGLPRLDASRHEYTDEEVARATFSFGLWTMLD